MVKYYQEGGPPRCRNEDETEKLGLSFGVASLPREGSERTNPEPRVGDSLAICVLGVLGEEEVRVSVEAPKGAPPDLVERGFRSPGEFGLVLTYLFLDPRYGPGQWHFKAQAGERTARMVVFVGKAAAPGYVHSETREHRYADFVIVGLEPHQRFSMHFYTPREDELLADYVSSATGGARADGTAAVTIDAAGAKETCYIAKLEVAGEIVDDLHNTLSYFCPRIETE